MEIQEEAVLLRIFIGETDRWRHQPLYEAVVVKAREMQLGGATVLRGIMGFGKSSRLHTTSILRMSQDVPVIIEIVESEAKVEALMGVLDGMLDGGLITLERAQVIHYRAKTRGGK